MEKFFSSSNNSGRRFLLAHLSLISDHLCGRYLPAPVSNVSFISRRIILEASVSLMKHETEESARRHHAGAPIGLQRRGISPKMSWLLCWLSCIPA
jgi:hypothetical protein